MGIAFSVLAEDGAARTGLLETAHGTVRTPAFMPVGTAGTVKGMTPEAVAEAGAEMILANTYHLMLRPGEETVEKLGGLHRFMNWPGPILTDSGGYQVMSLAGRRTIGEDGVVFRSHIDGARHELTPERAVGIQHRLGSDVTMALDECTPFPGDRRRGGGLDAAIDALGRALQGGISRPPRARPVRHRPGRRPWRAPARNRPAR